MFLNLTQLNKIHNQTNMINIYNHQQDNPSMLQTQQQNPAQMLIYMINGMNNINIVLDPQ